MDESAPKENIVRADTHELHPDVLIRGLSNMFKNRRKFAAKDHEVVGFVEDVDGKELLITEYDHKLTRHEDEEGHYNIEVTEIENRAEAGTDSTETEENESADHAGRKKVIATLVITGAALAAGMHGLNQMHKSKIANTPKIKVKPSKKPK